MTPPVGPGESRCANVGGFRANMAHDPPTFAGSRRGRVLGLVHEIPGVDTPPAGSPIPTMPARSAPRSLGKTLTASAERGDDRGASTELVTDRARSRSTGMTLPRPRMALAAAWIVLGLVGAGCATQASVRASSTAGHLSSVRHVTPARIPERPAQAPRPPSPRVTALRITRDATLVSYCWSGARQGVCADGAPGRPAHILHWRSDSSLQVDLRMPAHDVRFDVARIVGLGVQRDVIHLRARPRDRTGRRWTVPLPRNAARATDLLISARSAPGDLVADLGLRHVAS
jgi:hypothetical protein